MRWLDSDWVWPLMLSPWIILGTWGWLSIINGFLTKREEEAEIREATIKKLHDDK